MTGPEEVWLPLVEEPVCDIVEQLTAEDPEIEKLIGSPHRILPFGTFPYIRVGILLGERRRAGAHLRERGRDVEALLRALKHHEALHREVRAVAKKTAADPKYPEDESLGPDAGVRERFSEFARKRFAGE